MRIRKRMRMAVGVFLGEDLDRRGYRYSNPSLENEANGNGNGIGNGEGE